MIKLKDVSKIYYNNGVVGTGFSNISVEFNIGEFVVIVGESGSGKSTLLNVISGLDTYEEGEMFINGEETSHYVEDDFEDYRRKYVANIFQAFNLVNSYTVKQNVELVLLINGYDSKSIKLRVNEILKSVGIWELRNKKITNLSGGQKQKVAIARALAKETPIIIADEPTGNLDSEAANQIFDILHKTSSNKLVVVVTHNLEQVEKYATRIIRMHDGHIIEDKKIKKIEKKDYELAQHKDMSLKSKYLLSLRNTFNIIPRFLIVLGIFLAVTISVLGSFADINSSEYMDAELGASTIFVDTSPERIIVNKENKSKFSDSELKALESMNHVDKIVKKDWLMDQQLEYSNNEFVSNNGIFGIIADFKGEVEKGYKNLKDGEVLLVANRDSIDLLSIDDWLNKKGTLTDPNYVMNRGWLVDFSIDVKIVGYAYDDDLDQQLNKFYVTENTYKEIQAMYAVNSFRLTLDYGITDTIEDNLLLTQVVVSKSVPTGTIYIDKTRADLCEPDCVGENKKLSFKTFYEETSTNVNVLSKDLSSEDSTNAMVNPYDIYDLLPESDYQISIYVNDYEYVDTMVKELKDLGYSVYPVKETGQDTTALIKLLDMISYLGLAFILMALFFASYFVIYLVLKSKTTYYAVVRILGGNLKINKQLVSLELFNCMTLSYILTLMLTLLCFNKVIDIEALNNAIKFLKPIHYFVVYIIMIIFSLLLSHKYSKKIFKDSMISTYNGEI